MNDRDYLTGNEAAWLSMLQLCLQNLGSRGSEHAWVLERERVWAALHRLCDDHGIEDDYPDDASLADVIDSISERAFRAWRHGA